MGTRSAIVVKDSDGYYNGVYCHWDGYPEGVGKTLKENFNSLEQALEIISLGYLSCVCGCTRIKPIGEHSYKNPEEGTIIAYHRDRGDTYSKPVREKTLKACVKNIDHEYTHIFRNGKWTTLRS